MTEAKKNDSATNDDAKLSPVEGIKTGSDFLRGDLAAELVDGNDHFGKASIQLLKFHGTYEQDDRDARMAARKEGKKGKHYIYMVRSKIPGGKLTSDQLLAELDLGDELGDNTLRVTSRQGLQLHGVVKGNLKATIRRINEVQLSTLGACGDLNRNVMCCPVPTDDPIHRQMQQLAEDLAERFAPRTPAYHELWLKNGEAGEKELVGGGVDAYTVEPIYGDRYMPRKFKMGIALPEDNCIDIYSQDLGFLAVVRDGELAGYNLLAGGGFGVIPANKKTFPALARRIAFVSPDQALAAAEAVVKVQRDFGNRSDRKVARLKYLIADWGVEKFKAKVEEYFGSPLPDPDPAEVYKMEDHMGWTDQGNGRWCYGLNVENGRIRDGNELTLKEAIREVCHTFQPGIRLTAHQSVLFTDIAPENKAAVEDIFRKHGVKLFEEISTVRRWSMACVAWPTCGLAITESERALPGIIDQMEPELAKLGLENEAFTVRMTGCPNGCARPYNSDIGLVGKGKDKYTIYLGGKLEGTRLNTIYKDLVPREEIVPSLVPVFAHFKQNRQNGESFGDFCDRTGIGDLLAAAGEAED